MYLHVFAQYFSCYCHLSEILLQSVHIQEEIVQLGDASRQFDRHADRYKVS